MPFRSVNDFDIVGFPNVQFQYLPLLAKFDNITSEKLCNSLSTKMNMTCQAYVIDNEINTCYQLDQNQIQDFGKYT